MKAIASLNLPKRLPPSLPILLIKRTLPSVNQFTLQLQSAIVNNLEVDVIANDEEFEGFEIHY